MGWSPAYIRISLNSPETGMIFLPMLKTARSYLHSSGRNTGKWLTDRQICPIYYSGLHCGQCGRAVKMAAEFDVEQASGVVETGAADSGDTPETVFDVTELICFSSYSWKFWRRYLKLTTSGNTAVCRCHGISITVYYRRTFLDTAHHSAAPVWSGHSSSRRRLILSREASYQVCDVLMSGLTDVRLALS